MMPKTTPQKKSGSARTSSNTRILAAFILTLLANYGCGEQEPLSICSDSSDTFDDFGFEESYATDSSTAYLRIASAIPNPLNRGDNTWQIELLDHNSISITDAEIVLEPTMPGHGHGTFPATFSGVYKESTGLYEIGPFDLIMPGSWLFTFSITLSDGSIDSRPITFCVES